jgi:2-polyprenyl-6-hydroxyphenyl methylase/3-demethylubiquinone-9 3-methyltransferase
MAGVDDRGGDVRSVDPAEVAYYDRFAATWWDPAGPFWPIHGLNRFRTAYIRERLEGHFGTGRTAPLAGLAVLDVGCGGGLLAEAMAGLGASVHGIDVSPRNIEVARTHAGLSGASVTYEAAAAETLAARGASYDVVLSMEVVEHVADLDGFLAACCRLVRPGGVLLVATINRTPRAWLTAIFGAERVLGWLPRGTHRYRKLRKPREVARQLTAAGLITAHRTGVAINPLTRRFRYTRSLAVNYMLTAVRPA